MILCKCLLVLVWRVLQMASKGLIPDVKKSDW